MRGHQLLSNTCLCRKSLLQPALSTTAATSHLWLLNLTPSKADRMKMPVPPGHWSHLQGPVRHVALMVDSASMEHFQPHRKFHRTAPPQELLRLWQTRCSTSRPSGERGSRESLNLPAVYRGSLGPCVLHKRRGMKKDTQPVPASKLWIHNLFFICKMGVNAACSARERGQKGRDLSQAPGRAPCDRPPWAIMRGFKADAGPGKG